MPAESLLHPDLADVRRQLLAIQADAANLLDGLSDERFNHAPAPGRWSIAQCILHLNRANGLDLPILGAAINDGRRSGTLGEGPFQYGRLSTWFISNLEPGRGLKAKAPKVYVPPPSAPLAPARDDFQRIHHELLELVNAANGLDLARIVVPSPVSRFIKLSLGQRFRLIAAHNRRHLAQAWDVRRALP